MEVAQPLDRAWSRGRTSLTARLERLRSKSWQIGQCALAAGVAWFIAADVLGHPTPFFAPIAAVVSLGTSYGQRLRRVAEVTLGVAIGVFVADLLVSATGTRLVAADADRRARDDGRVPARRRPAVRHPGGGAVDRGRDAAARPRAGPGPLDRRADRRRRGPGRGDGGARGPAPSTARAGGEGAAQGGRPAAHGRRRDGRRRGRAGARPAGRRARRPTT